MESEHDPAGHPPRVTLRWMMHHLYRQWHDDRVSGLAAEIGFFALFGIYAINCLVQNYAEGPLKIWHYPMLILGIIGTFLPLNILSNLVGAVLVAVVVILTHKHLSNESLVESSN